MTKFSLVIPETIKVDLNGKQYPCIVLFGRGEKGERLKRRLQYFPYFYIKDKDYKNLEGTNVFTPMGVENVESSYSRDIMKNLVTKLTVQDASRVHETIHMVNKYNKLKQRCFKEFTRSKNNIFTYEADLSQLDKLPLRWMIDKGIKYGMDIEGNTYIPIDFSVPLRCWFLDFEEYNYRSGVDLKGAPLCMVSIWDSYENKMYTYYVVNSKWSVGLQDTIIKTIWEIRDYGRFPHEFKGFMTEAKFLDALIELTIQKDPDLLIGWGLRRYDIEKWKLRSDANNKFMLYHFQDLSPMHKITWQTNPHRICGRILFDLQTAFKQFTDAEMDSYSLQYVTEKEELGIEKVPFEGGSAGKTWDVNPIALFKRNINDVLIMLALDKKYGLVDTYDESRKEFGLLFHEGFVRNRIIDTALMRMVHGKLVLNTVGYGPENEKLLGGLVKAPEKGDYEWVVELDISRGYPTHIQGFNIGPETYRDVEPKEPYYTIEYDMYPKVEGVPETKIDDGMHIFKAYFVKNPISLLSQLITYFNNLRSHYQEEMQKVIDSGGSEAEIKKWERRQYNVKKTTNAIYGVMDYPKFRLHRKECTQAVAIIGRIIIEQMSKYLESIGYKMLYGDTDSTFIKVTAKTKEDAKEEGELLCHNLNLFLDKFFKESYGVTVHATLGFKAVYEKIKFFSKKMYCGKYVWEEKKGWKTDYEYKGIATVRSDTSKVEKDTLKGILRLDLDSAGKFAINSFINEVLIKFDNKLYSPLELAYPAQIKKNLKAYEKTLPAHVKAAVYSNRFLDTDYQAGDKPRRLPIKIEKKDKFNESQRTLFGDNTHIPTEFMFGGKVRKLTDISITEDFVIPEWYLKRIDYERIRERLVGKINKLQIESNIESEGNVNR